MKKLSQLNNEQLTEKSKSIIIEKLQNALKEELNAWYGYLIVKEWLTGINRPDVSEKYDELGKDELEDHAYWIMKRINELGGNIEEIANTPASWVNASHPYNPPVWAKIENDSNVPVMQSLETNINNELGAIETYVDLVETARENRDYVTESKCKQILADEEEHLQILKEFLQDMR